MGTVTPKGDTQYSFVILRRPINEPNQKQVVASSDNREAALAYAREKNKKTKRSFYSVRPVRKI